MSEAILTRRRNFKKNYDNLFGLKWEQSNFLGGQYTDIAYGDGLFVISCDRDFSDTPISGLLYSTDGKEWHQSNRLFLKCSIWRRGMGCRCLLWL